MTTTDQQPPPDTGSARMCESRGHSADNADNADSADSGAAAHADARPGSGPQCRSGCGACCIAPSISSAIPGMPHGKPAGVPCVQLDALLRCQLFGRPERPAVCGSLQPSLAMCGSHRGEAMAWLARLETLTAPDQAAVARILSKQTGQ